MLIQAAQLAEPVQSDDTHVPHLACPSSAEIQPQQPSSPPGQAFESPAPVSQRHVWGLAPSSAAYVHTSSESSADTSRDDGIELQEQGHVEALENTIGELQTSAARAWDAGTLAHL